MASFSLVVVVFALLACSAYAQQIGGATSVKDLVKRLITDFNSASAKDVPAYASVGSTAGINGFISGTYDVGTSDHPLSTAEYLSAKAKGIIAGTFPFTLSTYSVVTKNGGLSLTGCQIAGIYTGKFTKWEQISGSKRTGTIIPVVRNSGSGTTDVFTTYLKKSCASWPSKFVGDGPFDTGNPNLVKVSGSDGMGIYIDGNSMAIGYIQTTYGLQKYGLKEVAIQNKANKQVTAGNSDPYQSVPRTLPASFSSWSGVDLIYAAGAKTFPIVSFVYMFVGKSQTGKPSGKTLVQFLKYTMSFKGQLIAGSYYYSPIPSKVTAINNKGIGAIKA